MWKIFHANQSQVHKDCSIFWGWCWNLQTSTDFSDICKILIIISNQSIVVWSQTEKRAGLDQIGLSVHGLDLDYNAVPTRNQNAIPLVLTDTGHCQKSGQKKNFITKKSPDIFGWSSSLYLDTSLSSCIILKFDYS